MEPIPDRYNTDGPWFKGNVHVHTTHSDGAFDPRTVARMYAERGYDFLVFTDHQPGLNAEGLDGLPLEAIDGIETGGRDETGSDFHVLGIGFADPLPTKASLREQLALLRDAGAVLVLAHPHWTGNSVEDALRYDFDGVEVYNHLCHHENGKGLAGYHWDRMLERNPRALAFSADDAHMKGHEPWAGGWIMVASPSPERDAILGAIRTGNFYSTQGPLFDGIHVAAGAISVRTSPVAVIRLVDDTPWSARVFRAPGELVTQAEFDIAREHAYIRIEIEDQYGRRAWTNAVLEAEASGQASCQPPP